MYKKIAICLLISAGIALIVFAAFKYLIGIDYAVESFIGAYACVNLFAFQSLWYSKKELPYNYKSFFGKLTLATFAIMSLTGLIYNYFLF